VNDNEKRDALKMTIQLLLTGNELMAGHIVDSNSAMIAEKLAEKGLSIARKVTIGDEFELLVDEIKSLTQQSQVLLVNGGLGPTVDDLTAQALAKAAGQTLQEHPEALRHLEQWCDAKKLHLNAANRKQALLPEQAAIVANPIGSAVGFSLTLNDCLVICTPGVPSELRAMLNDSIVTMISSRFSVDQIPLTLRWQTYGIGESTLQQIIHDQLPEWPDEVEIGFRAGLPLLEIKLTVFNEADLALRQQWADKLHDIIGDSVVCAGDSNLASTVVKLLTENKQRVTTAESCTGGLTIIIGCPAKQPE
jgi:nicotinamide-nucleotide amidase